MGGGKPIVGIPQYGNLPSYSPPYPGMASIVWKPTLPIHPSSFWDRLLNPQTILSSSQIPTYLLEPQQDQINVSQPLHPTPMVSSSPQISISQPIQGPSPSQSLVQGTPQVLIGQIIQKSVQTQSSPYQGQ